MQQVAAHTGCSEDSTILWKRKVVKDGDKFRIAPDPAIDVLKAAQSVGKPTNEMCLRCHMSTGKPIYIKSGVYAVTGDPGAAAKKGAEDGKQEYSGNWKGVKETMVFSMNHQVAPRGEALTCASCHSSKGVLDFKKFGYGEERIRKLSGGY